MSPHCDTSCLRNLSLHLTAANSWVILAARIGQTARPLVRSILEDALGKKQAAKAIRRAEREAREGDAGSVSRSSSTSKHISTSRHGSVKGANDQADQILDASKNAPVVLVAALLVLAAVLRLLYLNDFHSSPLFDGLVLDERHYDAWAKQIAGGDWLGEGAFTASPLGPYVLAILYKLFGANLVLVRIIQMLANTASCYFIYRVVLNLAGAVPALFTLALAALYGPMIFLSANLVAEVWVILFISIALFLVTHPDPTPWKQTIAGSLFALGVLGRPNLMLLAPFFPLGGNLDRARLPHKIKARRGFAWFIGISLVLGPVALRNYVEGGELVVVTAHGGVNLWIGNNPDADGYFKTPRGSGLAGGQESLVRSSIRVAERAEGHKLTPKQASSWWQSRATRFMTQHPEEFMALLLRKVGYYLNWYEKPLESNYYYGEAISPTLRWFTLGFGFVGPLALAGMVLLIRRWRRLAPLYFFLIMYSASVIIVFISMRYRVPAAVGILPFAGLMLGQLWTQLRARVPLNAVAGLMVVLVGAMVVHLPITAGEKQRDLGHHAFILGNVAQDKGDPVEALARYEEAVRLYPDYGGFYNNLGLAYIRNNKPKKALEALTKAIALKYDGRRIHRNMARAYKNMGQLEDAVREYDEALRRSPRHLRTYLDKAGVLARMGNFKGALSICAKASELAKGAQVERVDRLRRKIEAAQGRSVAKAPGGQAARESRADRASSEAAQTTPEGTRAITEGTRATPKEETATSEK